METQRPPIYRGLRGVYFDSTTSSFIDGEVGKLLYRGYSIHDLAEKSTFEEIVYLLLFGELPTQAQLAEMDAEMRRSRFLPKQVVQTIELVKDSHPMDVLRTAISALGCLDPERDDHSQEATRRKGIRITAQAATIVTAHNRIRNGLSPIEPDTELNHAGNFLYMLFGERPSEDEMKLMDVDFIIHAEHGSNASSFAARVTASTGSDLHSAIVGGVGTLKGPWHGGAAEAVMKMALDIGTPDNAEAYARNIIDNGGRIMGFGHRVYKAEDPRARHMRLRSKDLSEQKGQPQWFQILAHLEQNVMAPYRAKGIFVNVDFWAGSIYYLLDIPDDLFVPIFAIGRIPGWTLQCMEQYDDNILIRPLTEYVGPMDLEYVPIEERG